VFLPVGDLQPRGGPDRRVFLVQQRPQPGSAHLSRADRGRL
jgi:hypothetical protein